MVQTFALTLPLILAGVFAASAIGKIHTPDDAAGWAALGIPKFLRQRRLVALHPWLELILAIALVSLGGALGAVAGVVAFVLMGSYLVLVVRAFRSSPGASCACFGAARPITRVTIARNVWLTVLALLTASVISAGQLWGGALAAAIDNWDWSVSLAIAAVTSGLIVWREAGTGTPTRDHPATVEAAFDVEDYVRVRTPAVPITLGDGTTTDLRALAHQRPQILLAVSETCKLCQSVIDSVDLWRSLVPEVDVRLLVTVPPEMSGLTSSQHPQTLHDPPGYVRASISEWPSPSAILLGADGLLAGGPVSGYLAIDAFIGDIRASLDEMSVEAS